MQALKHPGVKWITLGWCGFITENVVLSHNRDVLIENFGDSVYHSVYSLCSTIACGSVALGYVKYGRRQGPIWWNPKNSPALQLGGLLFTTLGFIGFSQIPPPIQMPVAIDSSKADPTNANKGKEEKEVRSWKFKPRCPIDYQSKDISGDEVHHMKRVTRHPSFWSLGLTGIGAALSSPFATEIVLFGMFGVFAFIGGAHQDYRYRRGSGGTLTLEIEEISSNVPFVALLTGKQSWKDLAKEIKTTNAGLAILLALATHVRRMKRI